MTLNLWKAHCQLNKMCNQKETMKRLQPKRMFQFVFFNCAMKPPALVRVEFIDFTTFRDIITLRTLSLSLFLLVQKKNHECLMVPMIVIG